MKIFILFITLILLLSSCGVQETQRDAEEVLREQVLSEDAESTARSDARADYEEACGEMRDNYLSGARDEFSYQIVSEIQSEGTGQCLLGYYYGNESGVFTYTLYNLSADELLGEVSCETDYDVENDIMEACDSEALQNLKMEYELLLETHRNI
ncbi:hypothetical protein LAT59_04265 [Candidatus Gracilibacteria bacterium]|nr:hypothetical protein [Candidatus Gracilibacteria bacterium]